MAISADFVSNCLFSLKENILIREHELPLRNRCGIIYESKLEICAGPRSYIAESAGHQNEDKILKQVRLG